MFEVQGLGFGLRGFSVQCNIGALIIRIGASTGTLIIRIGVVSGILKELQKGSIMKEP